MWPYIRYLINERIMQCHPSLLNRISVNLLEILCALVIVSALPPLFPVSKLAFISSHFLCFLPPSSAKEWLENFRNLWNDLFQLLSLFLPGIPFPFRPMAFFWWLLFKVAPFGQILGILSRNLWQSSGHSCCSPVWMRRNMANLCSQLIHSSYPVGAPTLCMEILGSVWRCYLKFHAQKAKTQKPQGGGGEGRRGRPWLPISISAVSDIFRFRQVKKSRIFFPNAEWSCVFSPNRDLSHQNRPFCLKWLNKSNKENVEDSGSRE